MPKRYYYGNYLQMTVATKSLLEKDGGFTYAKRETDSDKLPLNVVTYWLLGRILEDQPDKKVDNKIAK